MRRSNRPAPPGAAELSYTGHPAQQCIVLSDGVRIPPVCNALDIEQPAVIDAQHCLYAYDGDAYAYYAQHEACRGDCGHALATFYAGAVPAVLQWQSPLWACVYGRERVASHQSGGRERLLAGGARQARELLPRLGTVGSDL